MALTKTLYKRIFLLSAILVVVELIYIAVRREFVQIEAGFLLTIELVLTLIVSLLASTVILRLTGNKVWNMFERKWNSNNASSFRSYMPFRSTR